MRIGLAPSAFFALRVTTELVISLTLVPLLFAGIAKPHDVSSVPEVKSNVTAVGSGSGSGSGVGVGTSSATELAVPSV